MARLRARLSAISRALRTDWREIGGLGRTALIGVVGAAALAFALGFFIPATARSHLLEARAALVAAEVAELPDPLQTRSPGTAEYFAFEEAVDHELLGGETERVKLWLRDGTIAYSDAAVLVGGKFDLSAPAMRAFDGETGTQISDLTDSAHEPDRELGRLIEIYVPLVDDRGEVAAVFEIEQRVESLDAAMSRITRNVWLSILSGVVVLGVFMAVLSVARARDLNRRRRQAERLLGTLFRAQEDERRRIVGALHDDIGQPLYRLLYGLEGSRAKLPDDDAVATELETLEGVVRAIDTTLRSELRALQPSLAADAGLGPALEDIAASTRAETELDVHLNLTPGERLSDVKRTALYRAAREAVINVRKHANASQVWIEACSDDGRVEVIVRDDGSGGHLEPGLGLTTTRERLEALGGGLHVTAGRTGGTKVAAWLPIEEDSQ